MTDADKVAILEEALRTIVDGTPLDQFNRDDNGLRCSYFWADAGMKARMDKWINVADSALRKTKNA